jgi:hypothetical protein
MNGMERWRGILSAVLLSLATAAGAMGSEGAPGIPAGEDFGAGITLSEASDLGEVLSDPAKYAETPILLRGRISDVCQKKGCWLVLADGDHRVRIRFADYGFFVPKDCHGKRAYAEGRVEVETLSEQEARHYAAESIGGDPSAIRGPEEVVSFTATGVRIVSEH